ncbi:Cyanophycinase and related exopeptidases [Mycobacteroides abscessus subsp. abscessus]|nr:Cyanophycinase and related exopeptidases [Mycobacteroides abscessus subsp. abscessus]
MICLDISSRADAESEEIARRIESLAAVFITGGDQGRLAELILGSKVYEALHNSWKKGMPIAGTSAVWKAFGSHCGKHRFDGDRH